jgi:hypothetical protein
MLYPSMLDGRVKIPGFQRSVHNTAHCVLQAHFAVFQTFSVKLYKTIISGIYQV